MVAKIWLKYNASSKEQTMLIVKHHATTQPRNHATTKRRRQTNPIPFAKQPNTTANQPTNQPAAACQRFWRSNSPHFLTHTPSSSSNSKAHAHAHAHATTRDNKEIWRTTKKKKRRTKKNKKNEPSLLSYSSLPHLFPPSRSLSMSLCPSPPLPLSPHLLFLFVSHFL